MAAVRAAGLEAECCGMLPTPALALHAITQRIPAVMVTGSHIPFDRNGLKFYRPDGEIDKLDEQAILAAGQPMPAIEPTALPPAVPDALEAYVRRNLDFFPPGFPYRKAAPYGKSAPGHLDPCGRRHLSQQQPTHP